MKIDIDIPDDILREYKKSMIIHQYSYMDLRLHFDRQTMNANKVTVSTGSNPYYKELDFSVPSTSKGHAKRIEDLHAVKMISTKLSNLLQRSGFYTVSDIEWYPLSKFPKLKNMGIKNFDELLIFCHIYGIRLQDENIAPVYEENDKVTLLVDKGREGYREGVVMTVKEKIDRANSVTHYKCYRDFYNKEDNVICSAGELELVEKSYE